MFNFLSKKRSLEEKRRFDIVLALLIVFRSSDRNEVSLIEVNKSVQKLEKTLGLGYNFLDKMLFSGQLMKDLNSLDSKLIINQYRYPYNGFLPRSHVSLTPYGIGIAKEIKNSLPKNIINNITSVAKESFDDYKETVKFLSA